MAEIDAADAAFVAYGKGSGHPADLNFGDVFSDALAKVRGVPLPGPVVTCGGRTVPGRRAGL